MSARALLLCACLWAGHRATHSLDLQSEPVSVESAVFPPPPKLPKQTAVQKQVAAQAAAEAIPASAAAQKPLLDLIAANATQKWLHFLAPELAALPVAILLSRMQQEFDTAELVHNFGERNDVNDEGNCGMDVTLQQGYGPGAPYFFNQWLMQSLDMIPVDAANNVFTEKSETTYFHYPPFANVSAPDEKTAADRPTYAALNMFRISGGNPQCGPISAVFSRQFVGSEVIASPLDTGLFVGECSEGQQVANLGDCKCIKCTEWPESGGRPLGTVGHLNHLVFPFVRYYNATEAVVGDEYPSYNLARLLTRLLSRKTYQPGSDGLALTFLENTLGYFEMNPAVTVAYPEGIQMMIGMFDRLFGTPEGEKLRQWCISRGWPLAWAHNPIDSTLHTGPDPTGASFPPLEDFWTGVEAANIRLLDPTVLAKVPEGYNFTDTPGLLRAAREFEDRWKDVVRTIPDSYNTTQRRQPMDHQWQLLVVGNRTQPSTLRTSVLAVEPVFYGACANPKCIGVRVIDGHCVCRQ